MEEERESETKLPEHDAAFMCRGEVQENTVLSFCEGVLLANFS